MKRQEPVDELLAMTTDSAALDVEGQKLVQWGFTQEEIVTMFWLRQWYQAGGSDRALLVRQLEFLRLLVRSGELEL